MTKVKRKIEKKSKNYNKRKVKKDELDLKYNRIIQFEKIRKNLKNLKFWKKLRIIYHIIKSKTFKKNQKSLKKLKF